MAGGSYLSGKRINFPLEVVLVKQLKALKSGL